MQKQVLTSFEVVDAPFGKPELLQRRVEQAHAEQGSIAGKQLCENEARKRARNNIRRCHFQ